MACIFRKGKKRTWWIKYYADGKQYCRSLRTTAGTVARAKKAEIELRLARHDFVAPSKLPVASFLEEYCRFLRTIRTEKSYKNDVSRLRMFFGPVCDALRPGSTVNKRFKARQQNEAIEDPYAPLHVHVQLLEDLTSQVISSFITRRVADGAISSKTANNYREVLHRMFSYAIKHKGFCSREPRYPNPAAAVERYKEQAPKIQFLSLKEIKIQLEALEGSPVIQAMVATLIYAGLRRSEAVWLSPEDVDVSRRLLRIRAKTVDDEFWQPKTKKNRVVPISTALLRHLGQYFVPKSSKWYFPSPRGMRWDPDNFSQGLAKVNKRAGLPWNCLDFRHTFGSHLAMKGESLYKISELMGNSPEICRRHYAALISEKMHDVVEFTGSPGVKGPEAVARGVGRA